MTTILEAPAEAPAILPPRRHVGAAVALVAGLIERVEQLPDAALADASRTVEELGRFVDALRVRIAGEVDERSSSSLPPEERLSQMYACPNAAGLLALTTKASRREVQERIRLDRRTRAGTTLTGEPLPAEFPTVAAALHDGSLGVDAALTITDALAKVRDRGAADPADVDAAEASVVALATGDVAADEAPAETHDDIRAVTTLWATALDQDGVDPDAAYAERTRGVTLGRERDGLVPLSGRLMPETAGLLQRLFDAHLASPNRSVSFASSPEDADHDEPWSDTEHVLDPRTVPQRKHDALMGMLSAAASRAAPTIGGAAPTLVVTATVNDLDGGVCRADGVDIPMPARVAHRIACTGAVQKVVFDRGGKILQLGVPERLFSAHQRRAIAARDGGCIIPGCQVPASQCEIHHVEEHSRGGATHTSNGVMLCWWHHHRLDDGGWLIQMHDGIPYVAAPHWIDRHRRYRPVRNHAVPGLRRRPRDEAAP